MPVEDVLNAVARAGSVKQLPDDLQPSVDGASKDTGFSMVGAQGCQPNFKSTTVEVSHCVFGDRGSGKTLVLLGDSHSSMWLPAFDEIGRRLGWRILNFNKVSCGAASLEPFLIQESRPYVECVAWHSWVFAQINKLRPDVVVLTSEARPGKLGSGDPLTPSVWQEALGRTFSDLRGSGAKKVILGDIPYIWPGSYGAGPNCLSVHSADVTACSAPAGKAILQGFQNAEESAAAAAGARYIDVTPWYCAERCWSVVGNKQVYADWQHITATYARYLSGAVQASLASELG